MTPSELKAARRELGLNQSDLAKRLRTSRSGYVKWERGERPITGLLETAIELLLAHDRRVMQAITEKIARELNQ